MNYDVYSSEGGTRVGPNAPLNDTCAPTGTQQGSAVSAIRAWTSAHFPANQIVLGVASYGHSYHVTRSVGMVSDAIASYPAFNASLQPCGDKWDNGDGTASCTGSGGNFDFWGMVDGGFLDSEGKVLNGIEYRYDKCSETVSRLNNATGMT